MQQTRTATTKRSATTSAAKWFDGVVEGLNRLLDAVGPQPQLQPIPVKVRAGRPSRTR